MCICLKTTVLSVCNCYRFILLYRIALSVICIFLLYFAFLGLGCTLLHCIVLYKNYPKFLKFLLARAAFKESTSLCYCPEFFK